MLMPKKEGLEKAKLVLESMEKRPKKTASEAKAEYERSKIKSMTDIKERGEKAKAESFEREREAAKKDAADLPNLQKQHAEMQETYNKGKNWQYADREQNLSDEERTARNMRGGMGELAQRIHNVKKHGYKQGGKINLKDCKVSTHEKNSKHKNW